MSTSLLILESTTVSRFAVVIKLHAFVIDIGSVGITWQLEFTKFTMPVI